MRASPLARRRELLEMSLGLRLRKTHLMPLLCLSLLMTGEGMVDVDTGGDDMDRTEWSLRAVGHAAQRGSFYEVTYLEIISDITTRSQARVHRLPPHDHRGHALRPDHRPTRVQLL
jgi:hypothetical protein